MENFELTIAEILEVESVNLEDSLSSFDAWDSLTILSIIAYCDEEYKVVLSAEEVEGSETINGLKELIKIKL